MVDPDLIRREEVTLIAECGLQTEVEAVLLREHELSIIVNEQYMARLVCTDQYLDELVMGRLLTDRLIESIRDVDKIRFCKDGTEAGVFLNKDIKDIWRRPFRTLPKTYYESEWIFSMAEQFEQGMALHDMTACTHSCILARGGEILFACEDIGRHNAVDKAVGYGLRSGIPLSECILYTSGRVPADMAEKSIIAGIPVLASKSIPTADAVDVARKYGLVIIGNARPDDMKVFA